MRTGKRTQSGARKLRATGTILTLFAATLVAGCASGAGDFNGDGFTDIAVGAPFKDVGDVKDAGAVTILYGNPGSGRLDAQGSQILRRVAPGDQPTANNLTGTAQDSDRLGSALAAGDFNGDGYGDLSIGIPYEDVRGVRDTGAVNVIYGAAEGGLQAGNGELWFEDKSGVIGTAEAHDLFGFALATGNYNNDPFTDLAIGIPFKNVKGIVNAGAVNIVYGSFTGLNFERNQIFDQIKLGVPVQSSNIEFGSVLASGDFNGDGTTDLAVGAPEESFGRWDQAGAVNVIYGTNSGLSAAGAQTWRQDDPFIMGGDMANNGDRFGSALAVGDFDNDGRDDLAIGTPFDDWGDRRDSGTVNVLYGEGPAGLSNRSDQIWHQNLRGAELTNEDENNYGAALASGDYNGDGFADLAIGLPGQDQDGKERVGAVHVLYGSPRGLDAAGNQLWKQGASGASGVPDEGDEFGYVLTGIDLNNDSIDDLLVGARGDREAAGSGSGAVFVFYGSPSGLQSGETWRQNSPGLETDAQPGEFFGAAISGAKAVRLQN